MKEATKKNYDDDASALVRFVRVAANKNKKAEVEGKKTKFPKSPRFQGSPKRQGVGPGTYDISKGYMSNSNDKKDY